MMDTVEHKGTEPHNCELGAVDLTPLSLGYRVEIEGSREKTHQFLLAPRKISTFFYVYSFMISLLYEY